MIRHSLIVRWRGWIFYVSAAEHSVICRCLHELTDSEVNLGHASRRICYNHNLQIVIR
jgi:hypothetical protein